MNNEKFTAIIFFSGGGLPFKYRNVRLCDLEKLNKILLGRGKKPTVVNLYDQKKAFVKQQKLN